VAATRDGVRLAFVAALQHLTPLQRAVLILRDVLGFSAAETAAALEVTLASANSALQRARARMQRLTPDEPVRTPDLGERERELLRRYVEAFEQYDTARVVALLAEDARWEMPPFTGWYAGAPAIGALIRTRCPAKGPGDLRFTVTSANGQPAAAAYLRGEDDVHRAFQIHVLDVVPTDTPAGDHVRHVTCFFDPTLFDSFGLPHTLG
jgi:RNA polymerase sigma-70 factor (ECF subfamily)